MAWMRDQANNFWKMGGHKSMIKLQDEIWEGVKVQAYFSIGKKVKLWERILGGTENMGRNESMTELLMKKRVGITENHNLPDKKPGFFFKQRRETL